MLFFFQFSFLNYIVNYIIKLLVLINFISNNFKNFLGCRRANWAKLATNSENLEGKTVRLPQKMLIKTGEGVGQHAISYSPPPSRALSPVPAKPCLSSQRHQYKLSLPPSPEFSVLLPPPFIELLSFLCCRDQGLCIPVSA